MFIIFMVRLKVSENIRPYFQKYMCSSLALQEVLERHKDGVLGPPGPFAYANQPIQIRPSLCWEFTGVASGFQK